MKTENLIRYFRMALLISGTIVLLTSCEEKMDLTLDETYTRIVVEGEITSEMKAHHIKLMNSGGYFENQPPAPVSGAIVSVSDGVNVFPFTETPTGSGIYLSAPNVKGEVGKVYTLTITGVDIDGDNKTDTYTASSMLKQGFPLDSIKTKVFRDFETPVRYLVNGYGQESPTTGDFYLWKYYKNQKIETDSVFEWIFTDDVLVNGNYIPGLSMFLIDAVPGDTITVEARSITKEYYDFLNSLMLETFWNGGGFSGPPANIKGNISNGGQGFFLATDVYYTSTIVGTD